jgi:hypothetical protein
MTPSAVAPAVAKPVRWRRVLRLGLFAAVVGLVIVPVFLGFVFGFVFVNPVCSGGGTPAQNGMTGEDIHFTNADGLRLNGYYIAGSNGATIIIPPTYASGRGGHMDNAKVYNDGGFNVLTFDSRACGGHQPFSIGYLEAIDVEAAWAYLAARGDVDMARIGLHGFSSAGATSEFVAPRLPVRSVIALGNYHDFSDLLTVQGGNFLIDLYVWGIYTSYHMQVGIPITTLDVGPSVQQFGDRKLFLIYGTLESPENGRELLALAQAAGVSAELWIVEGALHGQYRTIAGIEYHQRIVAFHCAALGGTYDEAAVRCG